MQGKRYQLAVLVGEALQRGRPVLIGTGSVEESEDLARWIGGWLWWVVGCGVAIVGLGGRACAGNGVGWAMWGVAGPRPSPVPWAQSCNARY